MGGKRYLDEYLLVSHRVGHFGEAFEGHCDIQILKELIY